MRDALSLAIVGASARSAAASAMRAGFRPLAADLFADADLRRIATATRISPYPEGLLDWLRAVEPPAWMYTGALENYPELVEQMAWVAPLWGNSGDVLARVRSPWKLAKALGSAGHFFPETRESPDGLPQDGTWLTKTYRGASGSGVREWGETSRQGDKETRSDPLQIATVGSPYLLVSPSPCLVYQRRIAGIPIAAVFVAEGGGATLLGATRQLVGEQWLGAHGFQYCGSIGPIPIAESTHAEIRAIGDTIANAFELVGLFGIDMILDGTQVWTLEVNPRYTASVEIMERATGIQAIAAHAAACLGGLRAQDLRRPTSESLWPKRPAPSPQFPMHGKAILFAQRDMVIDDNFASATLAEALRMPWPTVADVSPAGTMIEAGRPVLTIFAEGATAEEVERQLRDRAGQLLRDLDRLN